MKPEIHSFIGAIPNIDFNPFISTKDIENKLRKCPFIKFKKTIYINQDVTVYEFKYNKNLYQINMFPLNLNNEITNESYVFPLTKEEKDILPKIKKILFIEMVFSKKHFESYLLQLKLLDYLVPNFTAIIDDSTYLMSSGVAIRRLINDNIIPPHQLLFSTHSIFDDKNKLIWMHTHGLNRFFGYEIELLIVPFDSENTLFYILDVFVANLFVNDFPKEGEKIRLGYNNQDLIFTIKDTMLAIGKSLKRYPKGFPGNLSDRDDNHPINGSYTLLSYPNDIEDIDYYKLKDDYLLFYPDYYSNRNQLISAKRIEFFLHYLNNKTNQTTFTIKTNFINNETKQNEFMWVNITSFKDNKLIGNLLNNSYYIKNLKEGSIVSIPIEDVVEWTIIDKKNIITPDNCYLYEEKEKE